MPRRESPLDQGDGPLVRFAGDLRALRERAGSPPYRQMAVRAHCSASGLSVAAGGRRLPSLAVTLAYVRACDGDVAQWQHRWQLLAAELAADTAARRRAGEAGRAPYPGAAAFEVADAERFFGRELLTDRLLEVLADRPLVVLAGPSGAGKSSLVRAGLLARLGGARQPVRTVLLTPGERPVEAYGVALARLGQQPAGAGGAVLVVDQAEELYTRCRDGAERDRFLAELARLTGRASAGASAGDRAESGPAGGVAGAQVGSGVRVLLVVRSDHQERLAGHPVVSTVCRVPVLSLGRPAPEELRRAIVEPAVRARCTVEGALLAVLVSAVAQEPGALPLVSAALLDTWRRRSGNALTLAGFQATGGFEGALARTAEALYAGLTAGDRDRAATVFRLLGGGPGQDGPLGTPVARREFEADGMPALLERLARARLVVLDRDGVLLAHQGLARAWPRMRDWLATGPDTTAEQRRLTEAARAWAGVGGDPELLYRGARLEQVRRQLMTGELAPGRSERAFLAAAFRAAAADRRRLRRQRRAVATLAAAGGALLTLAGVAAVEEARKLRRG
ncbi:hypothetical protein ACIRBX_22935 [Kitasatospora sp. NPDC096147]|uniref:nSTAND1 domain-containing NTPase n=1 Tax=Kitasatospora sp. NPDC096147 TaxID=3364093 RepID=UPI0037F829CA